MYKKILVPLDGSKTAENVLPYARCFSRNLQIPIELLAVVDAAELTRNISAAEGLERRTIWSRYRRRTGRESDAGCWAAWQKKSSKYSRDPVLLVRAT